MTSPPRDEYGGYDGYDGRPPGDPYGRGDSFAPNDPYAASGGYPAPGASAPSDPYGVPAATTAYAAPASSPTSGAAIAALVLGILSVASAGCLSFLGPVGIFVAVRGMRETSAQQSTGYGLAVAGLVTSILGTVILLGWVLYLVLVVGVGVLATLNQ